MTREDEAKAVLERHGLVFVNGTLAYRANVGTGDAAVAAMLEYGQQRADAEAAAMRERAAGVATDAAEAARPYANGVGLGPATERHRMLEAERIAAAIRALPATGEVGRG